MPCWTRRKVGIQILRPMTEGRGRRHQRDGVQIAAQCVRGGLRPCRLRAAAPRGALARPGRALRHLAPDIQHQEGGQDGDDEQAAPSQASRSPLRRAGPPANSRRSSPTAAARTRSRANAAGMHSMVRLKRRCPIRRPSQCRTARAAPGKRSASARSPRRTRAPRRSARWRSAPACARSDRRVARTAMRPRRASARVRVSAQLTTVMVEPNSLRDVAQHEDEQKEIEGIDRPAQKAGDDDVIWFCCGLHGMLRPSPSGAVSSHRHCRQAVTKDGPCQGKSNPTVT